MEPTPTPASREHKRIEDTLDEKYVTAIDAATYAQSYLVHGHGNPNEVYDAFYDPFVNLFMHTRSTRQMSKPQYDRMKFLIDRWMKKDTRKNNVRALLREGLWLFQYYQKAVVHSGAVQIRRE